MESHGQAEVMAAVQAYLRYLRHIGVTELAVTLPPRPSVVAPSVPAALPEARLARTAGASARTTARTTTPASTPSRGTALRSVRPPDREPPASAAPPGQPGDTSLAGLTVAEPAAPVFIPEPVPVVQVPEALPVTLPAGATAAERLVQLAEAVRDCQQCRLHTGRKHVVFGSGDAAAALVFVGEAPGRDEDLQGEPFVGQAGQLLTRIIEAMGLTRAQVYILNVIKCRPPNNRDPLPDEIAACQPIVQAQLACLQPKVICTLGSFATRTLLHTDERISQLRGRFRQMGSIQVMPTYHPAFLLRNPQYKRAVWEDMQQIQRVLELPVGAHTREPAPPGSPSRQQR